jgi:hypothetical protein
MNAAVSQSLLALALTVFIVFRFARRELKPRTVRLRNVWIRPAIMTVLCFTMVAQSARLDPVGDAEMAAILLGSAVLGLVTGLAVVRYTRFSPAAVPAAVVAQGSAVTFGIWIAALGVRLLARYALPHGADLREQLPLNAGTIALTAVAFIVIAIAFAYEARRYGNSIAAPGSIVPGSTTRQ